jgi:hypothetical protein
VAAIHSSVVLLHCPHYISCGSLPSGFASVVALTSKLRPGKR